MFRPLFRAADAIYPRAQAGKKAGLAPDHQSGEDRRRRPACRDEVPSPRDSREGLADSQHHGSHEWRVRNSLSIAN
jgi:hypothetical protein